jgi:hypothetical protein
MTGATQEHSYENGNGGGKARAELTRLARLSQVAVGEGGVAALLDAYVAEAVAATGATRGFAALAEAETGGLKLVADAGADWTDSARKRRQQRLATRRNRNDQSITVRVALSGQSVRVSDVASDMDEEYRPFFPGCALGARRAHR